MLSPNWRECMHIQIGGRQCEVARTYVWGSQSFGALWIFGLVWWVIVCRNDEELKELLHCYKTFSGQTYWISWLDQSILEEGFVDFPIIPVNVTYFKYIRMPMLFRYHQIWLHIFRCKWIDLGESSCCKRIPIDCVHYALHTGHCTWYSDSMK